MQCFSQGVPLDVVVDGFHQAVDICILQLQCSKIAVADILNDHEPSKPSHTSCCNSDNLLRDATSDTVHSLENLPGRQLEEMSKVTTVDDLEKSNVSPVSQRDAGDDDDAVSWYFDGLDLGDDGLEMLINAAGDMQRELGCIVDVEATSLGETSGHVIHGGESGDGLAAMTVDLPFPAAVALPGGGNALPPDLLFSCAEKGGLEPNVTTETDMLLDNDKQARFVSIMQELARTSKLLAYCNKPMSDAKTSDITDTIDSGGHGGRAIELSMNGAICNSDAGSSVELSGNLFGRASYCKQIQPDCTCSSKHESVVSGSVCIRGLVCRGDASYKCDTKSGSCESHCPESNVSQDSHDEFSSCFDDVELIVDDNKSSKQLFHTKLPHCGRCRTSAGLSILDDARDGTLLGKSITLNNSFEDGQEKFKCGMSSDLFGSGRHFGSFQPVHPKTSTRESCLNSEAIFLKSSRHFQNTSYASLDNTTLHTTPVLPGDSNPATQTDCSFDESKSYDILSKCQRENANNTSRIHSEGDLARKIHTFTRCLSKGCDDILDSVAETMVRQLNSDRSTPEDLR